MNARPRIIALAVAASLAFGTAWANPSDPTVTHGSATFSTSGGSLTVTNSPNTIINWHDFSIASGELTRFIQQSGNSAVLNRVTGGDPSLILGTLQSNGRVFLINPAGIIFGAGSVVDVGGLVASTLNITDEDFLAGKHFFNATTADVGNVTNAGEIRTPNGGFVYLIGTQVENSGIINTPGGEAILAAGHSVEIVDSTAPALRVVVSAKSQDVNLSKLMVENDGNIFGVLNSGRVSANTVTQDATGKIYFKSAGDIETTAASIVEAKGSATLDGGYIQGFASLNGVYKGNFDASGRNGGFLETSAAYLDIAGISLNLGTLSNDGVGGLWLLDPFDFTINATEAGTIATALNNGTSVTIDTEFASATGAAVNGSAGNGNITVNADIIKTSGGDATLTLKANQDITLDTGVNIAAQGVTVGKLNVTLHADSDSNGTGTITLTPRSVLIDTNGGDLVMGGGSDPLTGLAQSIVLNDALLDTGTGNITINGNGILLDQGGAINANNLTMNAGTGQVQLIGDGSGDVDILLSGDASLTGASILMDTQLNLSVGNDLTMSATGASGIQIDDDSHVIVDGTASLTTTLLSLANNSSIAVDSALTVDASGAINIDSSSIDGGILSGATSVSADSVTLTDSLASDDSSITGANGLQLDVANALSLDSSFLQGGSSSGATVINAGSLTVMDSQSTGMNTITGENGLAITVQNGMSLGQNTQVSSGGGGSNVNITVGGAMTLSDTTIQANNNLTISAGASTLADSTLEANGDLSMTVASLSMTRSAIGNTAALGLTPTNIDIISSGNITLNDSSQIVADQEISMEVGGKLFLNSNAPTAGASHISTFSDNTIFLYFPNLFSGGYVLDGTEGILFSAFNPDTGFFTGTNLNNLAILNNNLFITYATPPTVPTPVPVVPASDITGIISQNTTTPLVTNPYLDPFGPRQIGPGDSSFPSDVRWGPFPPTAPFTEVQECS